MSLYHRYFFLSLGVVFSLLPISCASQPPKQVISTSTVVSQPQVTPSVSASTGAYHVVQRGETLWKISKIYNVPVAAIKQTNHIAGSSIKTGCRLFIPGCAPASSRSPMSNSGPVSSASSPYIGNDRNFIWPVRGRVITRFGEIEDDVTTKGIDIAAVLNQPVAASRSGTVSFVSESVKGYGKMVILDHGNAFQTVYAYNAANLVSKGQKVRQGETIAHTGVSSRNQMPALHFEIRKSHQPLNPEQLLA